MRRETARGRSDRATPDGVLDRVDDLAVFIVSDATHVDYVSPAFESIVGLDPADATDVAALLERVHPDDRDRVGDIVADLTDDPREFEYEHRLATDDDRERWIRVHLVPLRADDSPVAIGGVVTDITEQKRREAELVLLHRILRHDIRNGLAVVTGWLDVLDDQTDDQTEDTHDVVHRVKTASAQMLELVDDTKDAVAVASGDDDPELEPVDLRTVLDVVLAEVTDLYEHARFALDSDVPAAPVTANALLSTVLRNILRNAVQHTDRDTPHVTVTVTESDDTVTVRVADDGPGVPPKRRPALFRMGEKGPDSDGTGFGLYICKRIVDSYGGRIWYEEGDPRGAVFCVELQTYAA
ncbi:MAG: ATP-binding protein [Halarchaeum sp.]